MSPVLNICCIIANDAVKQNGRYVDIGPNSSLRTKDAVDWTTSHLPTAEIVWVFGAGTASDYSNSKTLATLGEAALRRLVPDAKTLTNHKWWEAYGTTKEMRQKVKMVADYIEFNPRQVRFVFFTQKRHMPRVKLIWHLFFEKRWGKAVFVVTRHVEELSLLREWLKRQNERLKYLMGR